jgi:predicted GH43/DUF377 family glycosyl hydrolase
MRTLLSLIFSLSSIVHPLFSISIEKLPKELREVPFADDLGLIINVKKVNISAFPFAYNASMISFGDYYKLFFRYDTPVLPPYNSGIGVVSLDGNFDPIETEIATLSTNNNHSEDPRAFWYDEKIFISYSAFSKEVLGKISIHLARLDLRSIDVDEISNLDIGLQKVEKNWTPFIDNDALMFLYYIYPHKVLAVKEKEGKLCIELSNEELIEKRSCCWNKCYGPIRGGTPAILISEDEYLSFFHSFFRDETGFIWYVMGAYTFDAKPPYKMLRVSNQPILFHSIYDSWTYHRDKYSIFPSGLVIEGDRVLVSCGENDCAIKILSFDKQKLLDSLVNASNYKVKFSRFGSFIYKNFPSSHSHNSSSVGDLQVALLP